MYTGTYSEKDSMPKEYESELDELTFRVMQFINTKIKTLKLDPTVLLAAMHCSVAMIKKQQDYDDYFVKGCLRKASLRVRRFKRSFKRNNTTFLSSYLANRGCNKKSFERIKLIKEEKEKEYHSYNYNSKFRGRSNNNANAEYNINNNPNYEKMTAQFEHEFADALGNVADLLRYETEIYTPSFVIYMGLIFGVYILQEILKIEGFTDSEVQFCFDIGDEYLQEQNKELKDRLYYSPDLTRQNKIKKGK